MVNGFRISDSRGLNKERGSKFRVGSRIRQTPAEGRRTYRLKRYEYIKEGNSPKTLNDKTFFVEFPKFFFFFFFFAHGPIEYK